ncbi:hypothetical protein RJZ56_003131 [Blastomyces dermatitidis]|uniref:BOD1/SHG1 domain-containing protein n=1 Tax=Ajellomyces dermatitidis (strain ER-3 / ATCC MYA-2586) TaxID=559297 RepID=A0ABP2F4X2_AJEDR|nr:uncharacterized protein BDCG_05418 [Blastomyces dermatitidis ER-3]EEQ90298.1 hypothetical protein BDCG_05418 [Blastomyces dermatitidis ER-3]
MTGSDVETAGVKRPGIDLESLQRKKFKTSDLPLSAAQRTSIDGLLYAFKKKGGFDSVRKKIWAEFSESEAKNSLTSSLIKMAESEIDRDPSLLSRERGKAATLIEGAVDRSDLYKSVEGAIDAICSNHLDYILDSLRTIRRQEVGEEMAALEEERGSRADEYYEREVKTKRNEREIAWLKELEKQKQREIEEAKARAEELRKQRELEKQREEEERKKKLELEEKRRAEREKIREERRLLEEQREKEREERYERRRREREKEREDERERDRESRDRDRDRDRGRDRDRDTVLDRSPRRSRQRSRAPEEPIPAIVDEKSLEDAALELLLKEGKELAEKSRQKPEFDFEQAEALENAQLQQPQPQAQTQPQQRSRQSSVTDSKALRTDQTRSRASHSRLKNEVSPTPKSTSKSDTKLSDDRHDNDRDRDRDRDRSERDRDRDRGRDRDRDRDRYRDERSLRLEASWTEMIIPALAEEAGIAAGAIADLLREAATETEIEIGGETGTETVIEGGVGSEIGMTVVTVRGIIREAAPGLSQPGDVAALDPAPTPAATGTEIGIEVGNGMQSGISPTRAQAGDPGLEAPLILTAMYLLPATVVGRRPDVEQGRQIETETGIKKIDQNFTKLIGLIGTYREDLALLLPWLATRMIEGAEGEAEQIIFWSNFGPFFYELCQY